jgi:hypothetical protein
MKIEKHNFFIPHRNVSHIEKGTSLGNDVEEIHLKRVWRTNCWLW